MECAKDSRLTASELSTSPDVAVVEHHRLNNEWTLWAHLPHDTDWSKLSYKNVHTVNTVEDTIAMMESLPEVLVVNCMLFIMKQDIVPVWEDPYNRNGGCFSYKIPNKSVYSIWKSLTFLLLGNNISRNKAFGDHVNGITISPKKSFCIIKIWMSSCEFQNPELVTTDVAGLTPVGCLFKKHVPEY